MALYTLSLWELVELHGKAWLDNYPLFDPAHREELNQSILDTYWNREIAHESTPLFFLAFRNHMRLNMPVFNKFYESEKIAFDPMVTTKIETTSDAASETKSKSDGSNTNTTHDEGVSESSTDSETKGLNVGYAFPQTRLDNRKDYATSAGDSEGESSANTSGSQSANSTAEGSDTRTSETEAKDAAKSVTVGYQGIPADLINAFRSTIIGVDLMVVNSLEPLFMGVWGTNSPRLERRF